MQFGGARAHVTPQRLIDVLITPTAVQVAGTPHLRSTIDDDRPTRAVHLRPRPTPTRSTPRHRSTSTTAAAFSAGNEPVAHRRADAWRVTRRLGLHVAHALDDRLTQRRTQSDAIRGHLIGEFTPERHFRRGRVIVNPGAHLGRDLVGVESVLTLQSFDTPCRSRGREGHAVSRSTSRTHSCRGCWRGRSPSVRSLRGSRRARQPSAVSLRPTSGSTRERLPMPDRARTGRARRRRCARRVRGHRELRIVEVCQHDPSVDVEAFAA